MAVDTGEKAQPPGVDADDGLVVMNGVFGLVDQGAVPPHAEDAVAPVIADGRFDKANAGEMDLFPQVGGHPDLGPAVGENLAGLRGVFEGARLVQVGDDEKRVQMPFLLLSKSDGKRPVGGGHRLGNLFAANGRQPLPRSLFQENQVFNIPFRAFDR